MGVRVYLSLDTFEFRSRGWHVDDDGYLHILGPKSLPNVATFAPGWSFAEITDLTD